MHAICRRRSVAHGDVANLAAKSRLTLLYPSADDERIGALGQAQSRDVKSLDPAIVDVDFQCSGMTANPDGSEALGFERGRHDARVLAPNRAVRHFEAQHLSGLRHAEAKAPETAALGLAREQAALDEIAGGRNLEREFEGLAIDGLPGVNPHSRARLAAQKQCAPLPLRGLARAEGLDHAIATGHIVVDQCSLALVEHPLPGRGEAIPVGRGRAE